MQAKIYKELEEYALKEGYKCTNELLFDYGLLPSVKMPKHKKREFALLLLKLFMKK